ncbi:hypothetical protein ACPUVO_15635 [Pseudocolwellia sp. HL-MZ19]|uniref:hypothetical protein n=1 Tax=Pseudocolwellia sp. HL-MZ19 TaxID=3400846 RepID=UPI003CF8B3C6
MRNILVLLSIYPFIFAYAEEVDKCDFMKKADEILLSDPVEAAKLYKHTGPQRFLAISNGRTPTVSVKGFSNEKELSCIYKQYEFSYIEAGYDVIRCKGQKMKGELLVEYAAEYNKQLVIQYKNMGLYQCAI